MALFKRERDRSEQSRPGEALAEKSIRPGPVVLDPAQPTRGSDRGGVSMASYTSSAEKTLDPGPGQASAFLGRGTRISGKVSFEGPARIEGQIEGEVMASDSLIVGESAVVNAQITGGTVVIHGKVTGDINAAKRLELRSPGRVYGNVTTPSLVIDEGVVFEGHCSMGAAESRGSKVTLLAKEDKPVTPVPPSPLKAQGEVK